MLQLVYKDDRKIPRRQQSYNATANFTFLLWIYLMIDKGHLQAAKT